MSKSSLKHLNAPTKFTRKVLKEVTDERYDDAVYVLMHSYAARNAFAWMQYELGTGDILSRRAYARVLEAISCEVAHKAHGRRRTGVASHTWLMLAEELRIPDEVNEWGEFYVRTIVGWWRI